MIAYTCAMRVMNTAYHYITLHCCAGLAIGVYGHNYNTTIDRNEFEWLGGSAVALWGRTSAWLNANRSQALPCSDHPNGPDGTVRATIVSHTHRLWAEHCTSQSILSYLCISGLRGAASSMLTSVRFQFRCDAMPCTLKGIGRAVRCDGFKQRCPRPWHLAKAVVLAVPSSVCSHKRNCKHCLQFAASSHQFE